MIKEVERTHHGNSRTKPHKRTPDQLTFRIPFINKIDNEIRRALDRHNIEARIVHPKPRTLLQLAEPKMEPKNDTQKPAQSNTPFAQGPMWSTRSRVNFAGSATLDPLCMPSTTERDNTSPLPKIKPRPSAMGVHYYRKRRSASYLVREVRSVREREREIQRE